VLIREFEVFSIPEPGTWALLLLGGFAFVVTLRWRRLSA